MDWFEGSISEAAQLCKERGKWLLIAIPGESKSSKKLETLINNSQVGEGVASDKYICLRLREDSMDYFQFWKMFPTAVEAIRGDDNSRILVQSKTALPSTAAAASSMRSPSLQEQLQEQRKMAALKHQLELEERKQKKLFSSPEKKAVERREWQAWQDMDKCLKHAEEVKQEKLEKERLRKQVLGWHAEDRAKRNMIPNAIFATRDTKVKAVVKTPGGGRGQGGGGVRSSSGPGGSGNSRIHPR